MTPEQQVRLRATTREIIAVCRAGGPVGVSREAVLSALTQGFTLDQYDMTLDLMVRAEILTLDAETNCLRLGPQAHRVTA